MLKEREDRLVGGLRVLSKQLKQPAIFVFFSSILITLIFWTILPSPFQIMENSDYRGSYEPMARNILAGRGPIYVHGTAIIRYPPGYPFILAGIFRLSRLLNVSEGYVLSLFILICIGLASVFVFFIAQSVWGTFPALISPLVWASYPFVLWLTKEPTSEVPFIVFLYGGFCLFWYGLRRKRHAWLIYLLFGILVGFASLIRLIAIGIGLVMGIILILVGRNMRLGLRLFLAGAILLGNLAAVFPWAALIYSSTGRIMPQLSMYGVSSIRDGLECAVTTKSWRKGFKLPQDVAALMKDVRLHHDELESFGNTVSFIKERLRRQPLTVAKLFLIKLARSWYGTNSNRFEIQIMLIQIPYLILILWSTIVACKQGGTAKQLAISIWLTVAYFWGMTISVLSILRYMTPAIGLLFILFPVLFKRNKGYIKV